MLLLAQAGMYTGYNSVLPFQLVMKMQRPQTRAHVTPCSSFPNLVFCVVHTRAFQISPCLRITQRTY